MKIAFISYEYPPDTTHGGIATYVYQASQVLQQRGHHVEVFSGSLYRYGMEEEAGIFVHRIQETNRHKFPERVSRIFADRHAKVQFDVLEGPDIFAEAREAVRLVPEIPLVVKLHIPSFLIDQINHSEIPLTAKVRPFLGAVRRGINPFQFSYDPNQDIEYLHALDADEVVILTKSMKRKVLKVWNLDTQRISQIPNPYLPSSKLLSIPVETQTQTVTFIGRLETRKGVIDLAKAIPLIIQRHPQVKFRFVGRSVSSPKPELTMRQYLEGMLGQYLQSVEFTDAVTLNEIPEILAKTDICVFPSLWENFPNVCLEAMAAARGVIGSQAGGMAEMLDYGKVGRLVPPRSPQKIAQAVIELLENPELRMQLGRAARNRLLSEYGVEQIGALLETSYHRAIARRRVQGPRNQLSPLAFVDV